MSRHPVPQYADCTGPVLAVDGGGTKTLAQLFLPGEDESVATAEAGRCNPSTDLALAVESLLDAWSQIAAATSVENAETNLVMGVAGLVPEKVRLAFVKEFSCFKTVVPLSDGYAALVGAGGGEACAMVVAGTGCAGHRMRPDGTSFQRDGWGWICGDRGSGVWIGMRSIEYALAVRDGLLPSDALADAQLDALGGQTALIASWLAACGPGDLAKQARLVFEHAKEGLPRAEQLLDAAAAELRQLFLSLECEEEEPLFVAGSIAAELRERIGKGLHRMPEEISGSSVAGCHLVARGAAPLEWLPGT